MQTVEECMTKYPDNLNIPYRDCITCKEFTKCLGGIEVLMRAKRIRLNEISEIDTKLQGVKNP